MKIAVQIETRANVWADASIESKADRDAIAKADKIQVVSFVDGKNTMDQICDRINHFSEYTGVTAQVVGRSEYNVTLRIEGISGNLGMPWARLALRLVARQVPMEGGLTRQVYKSKVREQIVRQFLPCLSIDGSRLAQYGKQADLMADESYSTILRPIMVAAGLFD